MRAWSYNSHVTVSSWQWCFKVATDRKSNQLYITDGETEVNVHIKLEFGHFKASLAWKASKKGLTTCKCYHSLTNGKSPWSRKLKIVTNAYVPYAFNHNPQSYTCIICFSTTFSPVKAKPVGKHATNFPCTLPPSATPILFLCWIYCSAFCCLPQAPCLICCLIFAPCPICLCDVHPFPSAVCYTHRLPVAQVSHPYSKWIAWAGNMPSERSVLVIQKIWRYSSNFRIWLCIQKRICSEFQKGKYSMSYYSKQIGA